MRGDPGAAFSSFRANCRGDRAEIMPRVMQPWDTSQRIHAFLCCSVSLWNGNYQKKEEKRKVLPLLTKALLTRNQIMHLVTLLLRSG